MPSVDALVLAGGVPGPDEPLFPLTQGQPKALLRLAGRPMIQWVLDALGGAQAIRSVIVVGLSPDQAAACSPPLVCARGLSFEPAHGSIIDNLVAGARRSEAQGEPPGHILAVSSDIPLITPAIVDWSVRTALTTDHDAYYSIIPHELMEQRFPGSRRTFFKLKEGRFTAGDLNVIKRPVLSSYHPAWRRIFEARKSLPRQAALVGWDAFLLIALGQMSIAWGQRRIRERLGLNGRILVCPHPEAGMDVDKPHQYEMLKRELEKSSGRS